MGHSIHMTFNVTGRTSVSALAFAAAAAIAGLIEAEAQSRTFDISEQSASDGLIEFANQADIQVVVSKDDVEGKTTNRVVGTVSVEEGLASLISGTGLNIGSNQSGTYVLTATHTVDEAAPVTLPAPALSTIPVRQSAPSEPLQAPQEQHEAEEVASDQDEAERVQPVVVVTGSLISNPNATLSTPVNSTSADDILFKSVNTAEELLRDIPGVVPGLGSSVNLANPGASFVNLRGLGDNRNLVLMNGARLVPADIDGRFDLNNIPLAVVQRTDVLTGGASTTYGADAVSGVVNFVTKPRFNGVEITLSQQITGEGDGDTFRAEAAFGQDFAGGRGNAVFAAGYQDSEPVYQGDRDFGIRQFDSVTGLPSGSTVAAPTIFSLTGVGARQISENGTLDPIFEPYNFSPLNLYQTGFERYNLYGSATYEVNDRLELYGRALYSENTVNVIIAPGGAFGTAVQIPLSNPYLPEGARKQFCDANGISDAECLAASQATDPADPAYRSVVSVMSRRAVESGPRLRDAETTFQDYQVGMRGALTDTINWDVFASYGESSNTIETDGLYRNSRIIQSLQSTIDEDGNIICIDPSDNCVPTDWFGPVGSITPEMSEFLYGETSFVSDVRLSQVNAQVSGETPLSIPFANDPISFALGTEYRQLEATQTSNDLARIGDISGGGGVIPDTDGAYDVWEAFGEIGVPIIQDRPFIHDLNAEAGIRYSNYEIDAPDNPSFTTTTWKLGGGWAPVPSVRLRGNFSHAVRAPSISELFVPTSTTIGALLNDPCANVTDRGEPITGRPVPTGALRDTCMAQGAPASQIGLIQQPTAAQANITSGGNLDLQPEESDSWTIGLVLTPEFVPDLTLSVDYYSIEVTGAITTPTTGDIVNGCFNSPSPTNAFCQLIGRDPITGALSGDQAAVPGISLTRSNLGKMATDGIDVAASYRRDLGFGQWSLSATGNWTNSSTFQATPSSVDRECVGVYELNCTSLQPEFQWSVRNTLAFEEPFELSLLWRHIDSMNSTIPLFSGDIQELGGSYDFNQIPSFDYFDITARYMIGERYMLQLTVQNVFDEAPPIVGGTLRSGGFNSGNTFPSTYDALGRRFALTARATF